MLRIQPTVSKQALTEMSFNKGDVILQQGDVAQSLELAVQSCATGQKPMLDQMWTR